MKSLSAKIYMLLKTSYTLLIYGNSYVTVFNISKLKQQLISPGLFQILFSFKNSNPSKLIN